MKNRAALHCLAEHFFETEDLGTELDIVVIPAPPPAALVLDRIRFRPLAPNRVQRGFTPAVRRSPLRRGGNPEGVLATVPHGKNLDICKPTLKTDPFLPKNS